MYDKNINQETNCEHLVGELNTILSTTEMLNEDVNLDLLPNSEVIRAKEVGFADTCLLSKSRY